MSDRLLGIGCAGAAIVALASVSAVEDRANDGDDTEGDNEDHDHDDPFPVAFEPASIGVSIDTFDFCLDCEKGAVEIV